MVLADYLRVKLVDPLREGLRAEGRAEAHSIWREWNRRRREAEARGEAFDEPEPDDDE